MNTAHRQRQFCELRRTLTEGLTRLEDTGGTMGDAAIEIVKAGLVLSLAANGARATLAGVTAQLEQLGTAFPAAAAEAEVWRSFPPVRGTA